MARKKAIALSATETEVSESVVPESVETVQDESVVVYDSTTKLIVCIPRSEVTQNHKFI